jgi:hypothetical protein
VNSDPAVARKYLPSSRQTMPGRTRRPQRASGVVSSLGGRVPGFSRPRLVRSRSQVGELQKMTAYRLSCASGGNDGLTGSKNFRKRAAAFQNRGREGVRGTIGFTHPVISTTLAVTYDVAAS